mmetsp:Transcript_7694/g.17540  ORF Transcript_7694/g.17540 Transcript_7694/m.17540 type:complete len:266 (-) Transcript_7694:569-1366(-)
MRRISCVPAPISYSLASRRSRPVGYSFTYPLPPRSCTASSAHCVACSLLNRMEAAQSLRSLRPIATRSPPACFIVSNCLAMEALYARAEFVFMNMSASFACTSCISPIGLPNCLRSRTYGRVTSRHACMIPIGPPESTRRSRSRPDMRTYTPPCTSPSTRSAGTKQSSKTSSHVSLPRMPSLSSFCAVRNPSMSLSMRNAVMRLFSTSVFAYTTSVCAVGPFVIHILFPLMTYPASPRTFVASARHFIDTTSLPAFGSDMASAPT